jgi:hypothetical protein
MQCLTPARNAWAIVVWGDGAFIPCMRVYQRSLCACIKDLCARASKISVRVHQRSLCACIKDLCARASKISVRVHQRSLCAKIHSLSITSVLVYLCPCLCRCRRRLTFKSRYTLEYAWVQYVTCISEAVCVCVCVYTRARAPLCVFTQDKCACNG